MLLTRSSASVSVSPAPKKPGTVEIHLGLSRVRRGGLEDIPIVRERRLEEKEDFRFGEWHEAYMTLSSHSSSLSKSTGDKVSLIGVGMVVKDG
jgi:hypothetical protein